MRGEKYTEILKSNKELEADLAGSPSYTITILSNIIVNQTKEVLEYALRRDGINAHVVFGDYDNIVQDSVKYRESNAVTIFWELCNIIDGLHFKIKLFDDEQYDALLQRVKSEIDLVINNLQETSLVLVNKFTSLLFSGLNIRKNRLDILADQLNEYLADQITENARLVDLEKVIASCGAEKSIDLRYYYSSRALYTIDFFKVFAEYVKPFFLSANGKSKKALILDCDNTLWKGVLGEDGFNHIEMSTNTKDGAIYSEVQNLALSLNKQGVLIGLCSKNNPEEVDRVISSHPDMQIRDEHIVINKSNWSSKVTNLKEIARELNIGLDSLVFVDDSPFEVNLIKDLLPEVTVLQVPERRYEYPKMLRENASLFYNLSLSAEDANKTEMYKQQAKRKNDMEKMEDIEKYLTSLNLKMGIFKDHQGLIPRMSQMSQKTNQFNLTTKRYTEKDIRHFIESDTSEVFAFSVSDRYGDSGVTGLFIIIRGEDQRTLDIDTFLLSCRIIGRNIEYAFMDYLVDYCKKDNIETISASYMKTTKNGQVETFYDKCSFVMTEIQGKNKKYTMDTDKYKFHKIHYVEIIDGQHD